MSPTPKNARPRNQNARKPKVRLTDEHTEQVFLFQWAFAAESRYPELRALHAIPNFARISPRWGAWMKAEGKRAGVPDIHLPVARCGFSSLYIELKAPDGRVSDEQKVWHERLKLLGNCVHVCYGWESAKLAIETYLGPRSA